MPTNDNAVKLKLREFGEPIILFGEAAPERRERLRDVMAANLDLDVPVEQLRGAETLPRAKQQRMLAEAAGEPKEEEEKQREVFYTEGADELKQARVWLCRFTMERAAARLAAERAKVEAQANDAAGHEAGLGQLRSRLKGVQNQLSNFGDERPVSFVAFAPGSRTCATGSWSNLVKLWSIPDCSLLGTLRGHTERISGLAWHPHACSTLSPSGPNLVSAACDAKAKLWPIDGGAAVGELSGHAGRLSRVAFHPSGRFVGTASFDTSWRLWDVETCKELLLQEGHTRALYAIAFHPDGSRRHRRPRLRHPRVGHADGQVDPAAPGPREADPRPRLLAARHRARLLRLRRPHRPAVGPAQEARDVHGARPLGAHLARQVRARPRPLPPRRRATTTR